MSDSTLSTLIWQVADRLRGDYRPAEYGKVILPFTVLRRLDCVLSTTKAAVLAEHAAKTTEGFKNTDDFLREVSKVPFWNTSPLDLPTLMGDQDNISTNLTEYIKGFSEQIKDIFARYRFSEQLDRLQKANLLYQVAERFVGFDLGTSAVPQSSPHFAIASKLLNSLACEMALAKAVMSGASRCSGMLGMSS